MKTRSMRHLLILSAITLVISCRQKTSSSTTTRDTTGSAGNDSAAVDKEQASRNVTFYTIEQKDSIVKHLIDSFEKRKLDSRGEFPVFSELESSTIGYESSSNSTYYFDSLMQLVCVQESWQQEGRSGSSYYFAEQNHPLAFYEKDDQEGESASDMLQGLVAIAGNSGDEQTMLSAERTVESRLKNLLDLIERNKKGSEQFIDVSESEEVAMEGANYTRTTTARLSTELYKALVKQQKNQKL